MKSKKKLFKKIFWPLIIIIATLSLIAGLAVDWSFPKFIYTAGSSSIQPFMQQISKIYKPAEILSEAGGSSVGIQAILQNTKNIGTASKSPLPKQAGLPAVGDFPAVSGSNSAEWEKDQIKTITIAWDGIGIVYHSPHNSKNLIINKNNIIDLYNAFAGYDEIKLSQLQAGLPDLTIKPFARTGGSTLSGTAESFFADSRLIKDHKLLPQSTIDALKTGLYGKNTVQTQEANLQAFSQAQNFNEKGFASMVYLSASFIKNNLEIIKNSGFKIAEYQPFDSDEVFPIFSNNQLNVSHGYNWFRPFNLVIRLDKSPVYVKNFITWYFDQMFTKNSDLDQIIEKNGYVQVSTNQYKTMFIGNNFWVSDYQLLKIQSQYLQRKNADIWYGAIA